MDKLKSLLHELGISKVNFAKYLGVSRQMVYNYLEMENINDWPKDKKLKLFELLGIKEGSEVKSLKANSDYILEVEAKLNANKKKEPFLNAEFSKFGKKEGSLLEEFVVLIKEKLSDSKDRDAYNTVKYLFNYLQALETAEELKYVLGFYAKLTGFAKLEEFTFNKDQQILMESIMYSAILMYNNGGLSKSKILQSRERFVKEINHKNEERLSRTQELNTIKVQALRELNFNEITEQNAKEVFEKMAEIQSRKV